VRAVKSVLGVPTEKYRRLGGKYIVQ